VAARHRPHAVAIPRRDAPPDGHAGEAGRTRRPARVSAPRRTGLSRVTLDGASHPAVQHGAGARADDAAVGRVGENAVAFLSRAIGRPPGGAFVASDRSVA
jgi:hypothetical protein